MSALRDSQMTMARYLRDPQGQPPPAGVEERRLKIYRDLVYNNIEGFISGGFPVLRSLYDDKNWHRLVRTFIDQHRCHTPYFLEISQEFLRFLLEDYQQLPDDPPFMLELAHYEWVELALYVAEEVVSQPAPVEDMASAILQLSPLAWVLSYRFPVHRIGPGYQPAEAAEPTYLVVYRDSEDQVQFIQLNAATARLLELVRDNETSSAGDLLATLAGELGMDQASIRDFGLGQLREFVDKSVVRLTEVTPVVVAPAAAGE